MALRRLLGAVVASALVTLPLGRAAPAVEVLRAVDALPAHIVNQFEELTALVRTKSGRYLALDRRAHGVFLIDPAAGTSLRLLDIGYEPGRLLQPGALSISDDDIFAVLDAPNDLQRIQYFDLSGRLLSGFFLPIVGTPQMVIGDVVVNGVGAMTFTGRTFLVAEPAWGALFSELDTAGEVVRHFGALRRTGHETDPDLHLAFNTGMPLVDPTGGYLFVFQTGVPIFRRYAPDGTLRLERHIEGPELDPLVLDLPTTWTRDANRRPIVPPLVRTAAVDDQGSLWVTLATGHTYVYDRQGEKARVVEFQAAGALAPASLHFRPGGRVVVTPGGYEFETR